MAFVAAAPVAAQVISSEGTGKNLATAASIAQSTTKSAIQGIIIVICIILIVAGLIAVSWGGFTWGRSTVLLLGLAGIGGVIYWNHSSSKSLYSDIYGPSQPVPAAQVAQVMQQPLYSARPMPVRQPSYSAPRQSAYPPAYQAPLPPRSSYVPYQLSNLYSSVRGRGETPDEVRADNIPDCGCGGDDVPEGEVYDPFDNVVSTEQ